MRPKTTGGAFNNQGERANFPRKTSNLKLEPPQHIYYS